LPKRICQQGVAHRLKARADLIDEIPQRRRCSDQAKLCIDCSLPCQWQAMHVFVDDDFKTVIDLASARYCSCVPSQKQGIKTRSNKENKMKVTVIVKATKNSEAGTMPSETLLTAMGKYNEELSKQASCWLARVFAHRQRANASSSLAESEASSTGRVLKDCGSNLTCSYEGNYQRYCRVSRPATPAGEGNACESVRGLSCQYEGNYQSCCRVRTLARLPGEDRVCELTRDCR
jgi:hypothetical protein